MPQFVLLVCPTQVLFAAYAPLVIAPDSMFPIAVWAFLKQQKAAMQEAATRRGNVMKGETKDDFLVCRALCHTPHDSMAQLWLGV